MLFSPRALLAIPALAPLLVACTSAAPAPTGSAATDGGARDATRTVDARAPATSWEALTSPGPYSVRTRTFTLVDASRATPKNGTYGGTKDRTLPVEVWYPTTGMAGDGGPPEAGPFPVIAYAHGFLSNKGEAADLKKHLASHGYIVIAPDFPLSTGSAPGGPSFVDLANQPGDLAFVVATLGSTSGPAPDLARAMDLERQGVAGLSLGGATTLVAVYHPTLHLPKVKAAVAYAPVACFFGANLYQRSIPTVILGGSADELVPFATIESRTEKLAPPPLMVARLAGGTHVGFMGLAAPDGGNADEILGCGAVQTAVNGNSNASQLGGLSAALDQGTDGGVLDFASCGAVCADRFKATMRGPRQLELTQGITLAHFDAILRGDPGAARYLSSALDAAHDDITVTRAR